jgi:hypothetical protein
MESEDTKAFVRKARPILSERDYNATKQVLSTHAQTLKPFLEPGRFEGLLRELSAYETSNAKMNLTFAGHRVDQRTDMDRRPQRRWSDLTRWRPSHAA